MSENEFVNDEQLLYAKLLDPNRTKSNNYAFIDTQNLHQASKQWGWKLDYGKLREFLRERYDVTVAYLFVGFLQDNVEMYSNLQKLGYVLIFKEALEVDNHVVKGNCDVDLAIQVMIDWGKYDKAVIISADGDFSSLIRYLNNQNKLSMLLVPSRSSYSQFLKKSSRGKIGFLNLYRAKLKTDDEISSINQRFTPIKPFNKQNKLNQRIDQSMDKEVSKVEDFQTNSKQSINAFVPTRTFSKAISDKEALKQQLQATLAERKQNKIQKISKNEVKEIVSESKNSPVDNSSLQTPTYKEILSSKLNAMSREKKIRSKLTLPPKPKATKSKLPANDIQIIVQ